MSVRRLTGKSLLIIDKNLKKFCKYVDWLEAQEKEIVIHSPPEAIRNLIKSLRLGVIPKYDEAIMPMWHER